MDLYAVRWEEVENDGFKRTEFPKLEDAKKKALELKLEGKFNINLKIVDSFNGNILAEVKLEDI